MVQQFYMSLPYDLAGSMAKNRFRNELMWGLWKIFDIYNDREDFTAIFDYVCDIEFHFKNELNFYQLKTRNVSSPYTLTQLAKTRIDKTTKNLIHSILGKIYLLKSKATNDIQIKVAIVSNVNFKSIEKEYTDILQLEIQSLDNKTKTEICTKIQEEFPNEQKIDLANIYYIRSHIDLINPNESIIGKMVSFFEKIKGKELLKPCALYSALLDSIEEKACYEFKVGSYNELVRYKGITKAFFDSIVSAHIKVSKDNVKKAVHWIETYYKDDYKQRILIKNSLTSVVNSLEILKDKCLIRKKQEISQYVFDSFDFLPESAKEIINHIIKKFEGNFVFGYDKNCLKALIILVLTELEEKVNE